MFGKILILWKTYIITITDNIPDIGDIVISFRYVVDLSTIYLQTEFLVNIFIQSKVMAQKVVLDIRCGQSAILNSTNRG